VCQPAGPTSDGRIGPKDAAFRRLADLCMPAYCAAVNVPARPHSAAHSESDGAGSTAVLPRGLARDLRRLLGHAGFIEAPDRVLAYESDALRRIKGTPLAVALPATRAELQGTLRRLYEAGIPFVPRGAGTGLTGGSVAHRAVLVGTARLDRLLELDPEARRAVVEPGVVTDEISRRALPYGLRYLPDPGSASACTIGGNIATNAGGPHCLKHGVTSDHVLRLEVALPNGEVQTLDRGESGGLDLGGLFVGSEGTFGIVAAATVRLAPRPEAVLTALALFDRVADAGRAVTEILAAGIIPVALEIIDQTTIRVVERSPFAAGLPTDVGAALVIECEGAAEGTREEMSAAMEAVGRAGPREISHASSKEERERLWRARKGAYGALGRLGRDVLVEDTVVPRTALPELLPQIDAVATRHDLTLASFFHAGDGNLHPNIVFDASDPNQARRVESARHEILDLCLRAGGTITGEHGVGLDKLDSARRIFERQELETLRAVRRAFDPRELCNTGKAVPRAAVEPDDPPATLPPAAPPPAAAREKHRAGHSPGRPEANGEPWQAPETAAAVRELVLGRPAATPLLATGASERRRSCPPTAGTVVLSTANLPPFIDHRADDLTVTVGAGTRMSDLLAALERQRQWIPIEGPTLELSVGGALATAPNGPFDGSFGPLRRQLLGVRMVSCGGELVRWGRPVMKNVAGYDMPRLVCGSFGQLGVILEASFRLWPLPPAALRLSVRGRHTLDVARQLGEGTLRSLEVEGIRWARACRPGTEAEEEFVLWLLGSERSVRSREESLRQAVRRLGKELQTHARSGGVLPGPARAPGCIRPDTSEPEDGRSFGSCAIRLTLRDGSLWELPGRLEPLLAGRSAHVELLPRSGSLRVVYDRAPDEASSLLKRILGAAGDTPLTVERGEPPEHWLARARRPERLRALEARVLSATGGQSRCWQADYL
jgi:glycolate oxidase subunit GlcD